METKNYSIVDRGMGGYCNCYDIDSLEVSGVVVAVKFSHWSDETRKPYYEIPVSEKNQKAVMEAFPELDLNEDEPGAILLYYCDDETAVKVGMFAAELDGDLTPEATTTTEEATETASEAKTMQEIEKQAYRLSERNWRRKNVWETSEASKAAKNSRDRLICKAYLNAAAKHLTTKAEAISEFLSVKAFHNDHTVGLDYNSPGCGMYLKIGSPFSVESLLNNPAEVLNLLGA